MDLCHAAVFPEDPRGVAPIVELIGFRYRSACLSIGKHGCVLFGIIHRKAVSGRTVCGIFGHTFDTTALLSRTGGMVGILKFDPIPSDNGGQQMIGHAAYGGRCIIELDLGSIRKLYPVKIRSSINESHGAIRSGHTGHRGSIMGKCQGSSGSVCDPAKICPAIRDLDGLVQVVGQIQ